MWSLIDLGGVVGTFINGSKVQPLTPHSLNSGDIIGIGCPEHSSCRDSGRETFVYRVRQPQKDQNDQKEECKDQEIMCEKDNDENNVDKEQNVLLEGRRETTDDDVSSVKTCQGNMNN